MIPVSDSHKTCKPAYITYILIALNILIFIVEITSSDINQFILQYSFIPSTFHLLDISSWKTVFTAAFMHGGISHILFNMLFLWVFGDNVEEDLGTIKYILFYFGAIIFATLLQYITDINSIIPNLGASGAIAGILGYYLIRFPERPIKTFVFYRGYVGFREYPAKFFLGYWAVLQFFNGFGTLATSVNTGTAWFAHIGGLLFGILVSYLIKQYENDIWGAEYI